MIINYNPLQSTSQLLTQVERPVCEEKTKQKCKDEPQEKCQQVESFAFITYNKFLLIHLLRLRYVFIKIGMCICQDFHVYLSQFSSEIVKKAKRICQVGLSRLRRSSVPQCQRKHAGAFQRRSTFILDTSMHCWSVRGAK